MPSSDYWKNRYQLIEESGNKDSQILYDDLQRQYIKAQRDIENQINTWYQRFATNNQITMNEAKRYLTTKEFAEFKWDVKEYIKYGEENALNPKWMKELENASARFHISRLEALKLQTQQTIEVLYGNQLDQVDTLMKNIYTKGYNHSIYEIQKGFNVGWNVSSINENQLQKVISKPWSSDGKTFSENIWGRKNQLVNEVHTQLTQTLIQGKAPDDAIKAIAKKFGNGQKDKGMLYNAGRLIMTESAYFANLAQRDCFKDLDVEQYEIVATLDSITSSICRGFDGKKVDLADFEPNVTAPPFHCWCRTIIVPYFNDTFDIGKRAARGKDGKTYFVPDNMTYEEWEKTFVDGDSKTTGGLKEITDNVIIKETFNIEGNTQKLKNTMNEADYLEYLSILNNHSNSSIKKLYSNYGDGLSNIEFFNDPNKGVFRPATNDVEFSYPEERNIQKGMNKYSTLAHEYGHYFDAKAQFNNLKFSEIETIQGKVNITKGLFRNVASSSDEFLIAVRKDKEFLKSTLTNDLIQDLRKTDASAGVQDAIDGLLGKRVGWGHGDDYYNWKYNMSKKYKEHVKLQQAYKELGFDVSNLGKVKSISRDYSSASEIWANIISAETNGGVELEYIKEYLPNCYEVLIEILKGVN